MMYMLIRRKLGGRLKTSACGGASLLAEVSEFFNSTGLRLDQGYGLTETAAFISANRAGQRRIGSCGIPAVELKLKTCADTSDADLKEILVRGDNVAQGYWKLPEETKKYFSTNGWFRTGDLGKIDENGYLYVLGRARDHYKLDNGKYVSPTTIESGLKQEPLVENAFVFGENKPYNVCVISVNRDLLLKKSGFDKTNKGDVCHLLKQQKVRKLFEDLIAFHCQKLKKYERINKFVLVAESWSQDNDLVTISMKNKRYRLKEHYSDIIETLYSQPRDLKMVG